MHHAAPIRIAIAVAAALACTVSLSAETVRVLRAEVPEGAASFRIENLAGRMRVHAGSGQTAVVVATIHAENDSLASRLRLENVGSAASPILRVRYPEGVNSIRYRARDDRHDDGFLARLFSSSEGEHAYDGRTMRVASWGGKALYADVDVEVPRGDVAATFRNLVGSLDASDLSGKLEFEVESADLLLEHLKGDVAVRGTSGDLVARDIAGRWSSRFSSGDVVVERLTGDTASFETSSGDGHLRTLDVGRLSIDSHSGDFKIEDADVAELLAKAGSGDIRIETRGRKLASLRAKTGSGDVAVRLPRDASFDARATMGSGDMHVGFDDGAGTTRGGDLVAYRRGNGAARIDVETGSGNVTIDPD